MGSIDDSSLSFTLSFRETNDYNRVSGSTKSVIDFKSVTYFYFKIGRRFQLGVTCLPNKNYLFSFGASLQF